MPTVETPDKLLPTTEGARVFREQYDRSRREFMDGDQRDKFTNLYDAYRAYFEIKDDGQRSNLAVPLIAAHVDAFVSRLAGARPIIEVGPREEADIERAKKHRLLLDYQWDALGMLFQILMLSKTAMIHGIGWGKLTWRKEVRSRLLKQAAPPAPEGGLQDLGIDAVAMRELFNRVVGQKLKPRDVVTFDDPFFAVLEPDAIYPDPDGWDEDSCDFLIERSTASFHDLEAMEKGGEIKLDREGMAALRKALKAGNLLSQGESGPTVAEHAASTFGGTRRSDQGSDQLKSQFHLLEKWTDGKVEWAVEEVPQANLIRSEHHGLGMKPYIRYTPDPLPNELIGTALTERMYAMNMHMNTMVNAVNDATLATINAVLMIPRNSTTNPQHLRNRSRGWAFVDGANPPGFLQPPELKGGGYRYIAEIRQMAEEIGGTNTFRGIGGDGDTTATEADLLARAGGSKAGMMLQVLNDQPLKRLGRLWVKHNELHMSKERVVRILGDRLDSEAPAEFITIRPEDIAQRGGVELDVTIDIASNDPDTRQFKMRRMAEQAQNAVQAAQIFPELRPIARQYAVEMARLGDLPNPEKLLKQGMEEARAAQAAQQAAEGAGQAQGVDQGTPPQGQNVGNEGEQIAADMGAFGGLQ